MLDYKKEGKQRKKKKSSTPTAAVCQKTPVIPRRLSTKFINAPRP